MKDDFFKRALSYANAALKLLKGGKIPPTPQFFELFYTYYSGSNTALNDRLNSLLREGELPTESLAEALYGEFLQSTSVGERLSFVSSEMSIRISELRGSIDVAAKESFDYSDLLELTIDELGAQHSKQEIADMAKKLLNRTRDMNEVNMTLGSSLETARDDIDALKLELEKVRRESMIDPLTRIPNRKAFDFYLDEALKKSAEEGDELSLMLLDIDHFKSFNDNFGHQTGDQVLRLVANSLDKQTKDTDVAARYGGEEFAVIMPGANLQDATLAAERLRKSIRARQLHNRSTQQPLGRITSSFGVATFQPGDNVASLIERANRCLYFAKNNGRDMVVNEDDMAAGKTSRHARKIA